MPTSPATLSRRSTVSSTPPSRARRTSFHASTTVKMPIVTRASVSCVSISSWIASPCSMTSSAWSPATTATQPPITPAHRVQSAAARSESRFVSHAATSNSAVTSSKAAGRSFTAAWKRGQWGDATELHRLVDIGHARDTVLHGANGIEQIGDEQQVHDEAGVVLRRDRLLAEGLGERKGATERLLRRRHGAHDLDERHQRHRVEKVEPDEAVTPPRGCCHSRDGEARRVGRKDRHRARAAVELLPQGVLE